jgi:hypothetical protein
MCRSIKRLRPARGSDEQLATPEEIEAAALQFVRKISGYRQPASRNVEAFQSAVDEITNASKRLLATID